jgi:hypothetical protein
VAVDAAYVYDKAAVLGDRIKETLSRNRNTLIGISSAVTVGVVLRHHINEAYVD